jgi:hypothetical protein
MQTFQHREDNNSSKGNLGSGGIMVFNATFNNISVISWRSVVLVEEAEVPRENHAPTCRKSLTNYIT